MVNTRLRFPSFRYLKSTITGLGVFATFFMLPNEAQTQGLGRNIEALWTYEFPRTVQSTIADFALSGEAGYVLKNPEELLVFDLSNPATATLTGTYTPQSGASSLAVRGNFVFLSEGSEGIEIVDMVDPSSPEFVSRIDIDQNVLANQLVGNHPLHISDDFLFSTARGNPSELRIFDISDPSNPLPLGAASVTWGAGYAVDGTRAYVAGSGVGIEVMDISDINAPQWVTNIPTPDDAAKVIAASEVLYCAVNESGIRILDPDSGALISEIDVPGLVWEFEVAGNLLFLTNALSGSSGGVHAFDISDISTPRWVGTYNVRLGKLVEISSDGRIFAITDENGLDEMGLTELRIIDFEPEPSPPTLTGDLNSDGSIGPEDLLMMIQEGWYETND